MTSEENAEPPRWRRIVGMFPWIRAAITFLAGLAVLMAMRIPIVEQSLLGEPDRAMRELAFKLRADVFSGAGDPVLLVDIDDASLRDPAYQSAPVGRQPSGQTSRRLLADLLAYIRSAPPANAPGAVIMDVDIGAPSNSAEDVAKLHAAMAQWAADPNAPTLIIAREAFEPSLLGLIGTVPVLPTSDFDDIVDAAPNIYWGTTKMLADNDNVVREILPLQCVRQGDHVVPLFSAAIQAFGAQTRGAVPKGSPAETWMRAGPTACAGPTPTVLTHGELINYHLSMKGDPQQTWQPLRKSWPGFKTCKGESDPAVFRAVPAAAVAQAGPGASTDLLCRRLVIIGGANHVAMDYQQTPLDQMPGPVILANATRGLQIANGGVRALSLPIQAAVLGVFSLILTLAFALTRQARQFYQTHRQRSVTSIRQVALVAINPVVLNFALSTIAHYGGATLLIWALSLGHWGFLSGPVFGAAIAETIQDFTE